MDPQRALQLRNEIYTELPEDLRSWQLAAVSKTERYRYLVD
jgi:hypothetical protein